MTTVRYCMLIDKNEDGKNAIHTSSSETFYSLNSVPAYTGIKTLLDLKAGPYSTIAGSYFINRSSLLTKGIPISGRSDYFQIWNRFPCVSLQ